MKKIAMSGEPLGRTLTDLMRDHGKTFRGLAKEAGLTAGFVCHLAHGNRVASLEVMEKLAEVFGVGPQVFLEYRLQVVTSYLQLDTENLDALYRKYVLTRTGTGPLAPHGVATIAPCSCSYSGPVCPIHGGPVYIADGTEVQL